MGFILLDTPPKRLSLKAQLDVYLRSLSPTIYTKYNETSGNLINYGSDSISGAVSGATQGQTGQLGATEAYSFDGVDDIVTFNNADVPATKALTTQRWVFLINPTNAGEGNEGVLFSWGNGPGTGETHLELRINRALASVIDCNPTNLSIVTNTLQHPAYGSWFLVFSDYDMSDAMGLGRRGRIWVASLSQAVTLCTLTTNTAGVGAVVTPVNPLNLGNRTALSQTFNGLIDFTFGGAGLWTPTTDPTDLSIMTRIRFLTFGV